MTLSILSPIEYICIYLYTTFWIRSKQNKRSVEMKYKINYEDLIAIDEVLENGEGYTYKELCELLKFNPLPPVNSINVKNHIIGELKQYCDIEEKSSQGKATKYVIKQIYSKPLINTIHKNNKFQEFIEQAILTKALQEPSKRLYLSNIEILYLTSLVNKNFKIICNWNLAKQLTSREWLHTEAFTIYSILHRWLKDRLLQMHYRHIIELQRGYRVYKTFINDKGQEITIKQNVEKGSELEKKCQEIFAQAIKHTQGVSKDWSGEWLPYLTYCELKRQVRIFTQQILSEEKWDNVRTVNVIIPVQNADILQDSLDKVEKILNDESKRKIKETKQLNHLTGFEREMAIDELIDIHTHVDYIQLLEE